MIQTMIQTMIQIMIQTMIQTVGIDSPCRCGYGFVSPSRQPCAVPFSGRRRSITQNLVLPDGSAGHFGWPKIQTVGLNPPHLCGCGFVSPSRQPGAEADFGPSAIHQTEPGVLIQKNAASGDEDRRTSEER